MDPTWINAAAAALTAAAACAAFGISIVALRATYEGPRKAAEFAEQLRSGSQRLEEDRRLKLWIFSTLMQHRAQIANPNSVAALNLIDAVFNDDVEVRNAWRSFLAATGEVPFEPIKASERFLTILEKMTRSLGLSEKITVADVQNAYFPSALGRIMEAEHLEVAEKLNRLKGSGLNSEAATSALPQ